MKPLFVFYIIRIRNSVSLPLVVRVSGGYLCEAEAPTEAAAETVLSEAKRRGARLTLVIVLLHRFKSACLNSRFIYCFIAVYGVLMSIFCMPWFQNNDTFCSASTAGGAAYLWCAPKVCQKAFKGLARPLKIPRGCLL